MVLHWITHEGWYTIKQGIQPLINFCGDLDNNTGDFTQLALINSNIYIERDRESEREIKNYFKK